MPGRLKHAAISGVSLQEGEAVTAFTAGFPVVKTAVSDA